MRTRSLSEEHGVRQRLGDAQQHSLLGCAKTEVGKLHQHPAREKEAWKPMKLEKYAKFRAGTVTDGNSKNYIN